MFVWSDARCRENSPFTANDSRGNRNGSLNADSGRAGNSARATNDGDPDDSDDSDSEPDAESRTKPNSDADAASEPDTKRHSSSRTGADCITESDAKSDAEPQTGSSARLMVLSLRSVLSVSLLDTDNTDERNNSHCSRAGLLGRSS